MLYDRLAAIGNAGAGGVSVDCTEMAGAGGVCAWAIAVKDTNIAIIILFLIITPL